MPPTDQVRDPFESPPSSDEPIDNEPGAPEATDKLAELLEQFAGDAGFRVLLERIDPVDGPAYLPGPFPLDSNLLENVGRKWGGGTYGGRIVGAHGKYRARLPQFRIAGPARDPRAPELQPAAADTSPQHIATILAPLLDGFQRGIVDAIRAAQPAPVPTGLEQFTHIVGLMRELQPPAPAREKTGDMIATMRELMKLRDELGAAGSGSGGVMEAVREFAPIVRAGLSGLAQRNAAAAEPQAPPPGAPTPAPAATRGPAIAQWLEPFIQFRGQLLALADAGKNPALYADLIADNVSDDQANAIAVAEAAGTLERDLYAAVPELSRSDDRRRFAGALLAELRGALFGAEPTKPKGRKPRAAKAKRGTPANGSP